MDQVGLFNIQFIGQLYGLGNCEMSRVIRCPAQSAENKNFASFYFSIVSSGIDLTSVM